MNNTVQKNVVMIYLDIKKFSGSRKTTENDIEHAGGRVPKTNILKKGAKDIYPKERLGIFSNIIKGLYRDLWEFSVKSFGGGSVFAISEDDWSKAEDLIQKAQDNFNYALQEMRLHYDEWMNNFIDEQHDEYGQPDIASQDIIRRSMLKMEDACGRFSFSYDPFIPAPVGNYGSLESRFNKLSQQLYEEIASVAADAYDKTFCPMDSSGMRRIRMVGQRAKSPIKSCREKLNKMAFLNPNTVAAVEIIDLVLAKTQITGFIEDELGNPCATRLRQMVVLMTDAEKFSAAASKILASSTPEEDIDAICGITQQVETDAEVVSAVGAALEAIQAESQNIVISNSDVVTPLHTPVMTIPNVVAQPNASELAFF